MDINLPLRLTGTHQHSRVSKTVIVTFEDNSTIRTSEITQEMVSRGQAFSFEMSSGYDRNRVRITNIVGFNGFEFIKNCPHCGENKPIQYFDNVGRYNQTRDQSNCNDCRGSY